MPSSSLTIDDRDALVRSIALNFIIYSQKEELDDIKRGLDYVLEFGELTRAHPKLFKPVFVVSGQTKLRADSFLSIFEIQYSPREVTGETRRRKSL